MKDFLKYTLATITGIVLFSLVIGIFSLLTLAGMASMGTVPESIDDNSVMVIKLNGELTDRASEASPIAMLSGQGDETLGLKEMLAAIKNAKENDKIKGIYIETGNFAGATPALLTELRDALLDFKQSDKFILAYGDNYSQGEYYLSSVADSIVINPEGMVEWAGLAVQTMYYKKILEKVGVKMQVVKVGTYKSAVEPFMLDDISDANREQIETFSGEIWGKMLADVAASRGITVEKLNALTDSGIMIQPAKYLMDAKLLDKVAYYDEIPQIIANMMGVDKDDYHTTTIQNVAANATNTPKSMSGDKIAVYYAEGEIVQSPSQYSFMNEEGIVGEQVMRDLKKLADDDDVKAVVMRVNSPGGSAYASEQIWHQVMNIKAKKPIVVSMGGYAASGGYYISCAANWIVAQPTTLTGSIGIFGTFPDVSNLVTDKLGVNVATVKTNELSDFGTPFRPFSAKEQDLLQQYINRGYDLFTRRCADGRGLAQDSIKVIGEGRVWTGVHALQLGLVDQLGSLDDAIAKAKELAGIEECTIADYPAQKTFLEQLMEQTTNKSTYADEQMRLMLGDYYNDVKAIRNAMSQDNMQAAMPYIIKFNL